MLAERIIPVIQIDRELRRHTVEERGQTLHHSVQPGAAAVGVIHPFGNAVRTRGWKAGADSVAAETEYGPLMGWHRPSPKVNDLAAVPAPVSSVPRRDAT